MNALRNSLRMLLGRRPAALQVAAICRNAAGDVLLITSRGTGRWVIPKGWPMAGRSLAGAAAQEAWEEAGIRGTIAEAEIGRFCYDKDQDQGFAVPVEVRAFLLDVTEQRSDFPEASQRQSQWCPPARAAELVAEPGLAQILRKLGGSGLDA